MIEFFNTIGSYINKFVEFFETLFTNIQQAIIEVQTWVSYLPAELVASAAIIIVLLVVFRVLGR